MGFDDLVNKGKQAYGQHKDKIDGALHSQQAEDISDKAFDGVAGLAKKVAPEGAHAKIDELRDQADRHVGTEKRAGTDTHVDTGKRAGAE